MSKGLEALKEIKTCKLIDHVKVKEGLFSNKLLSYERRYGEDVFSKQIPIIEKELKALEILKAFDFEIEDHTEELNGSVSAKFKRIILDEEEIDLLKEVLMK